MNFLLAATFNFVKPFAFVLGFMSVPWTVLHEGPGLGLPGVLQIGFILLMIGASLRRFRSEKLKPSTRFLIVLVAYLQATVISNTVAFVFMPDLFN